MALGKYEVTIILNDGAGDTIVRVTLTDGNGNLHSKAQTCYEGTPNLFDFDNIVKDATLTKIEYFNGTDYVETVAGASATAPLALDKAKDYGVSFIGQRGNFV